MTDLEGACKLIEGYFDEETQKPVPGVIETLLNPLVEDGTVKQIIIGEKSRGPSEFPYIKVILDDMNIEDTASFGGRESWNLPLKIKVITKETDYPVRGRGIVRSITSKARNLILKNRQLTIPQVVRKVDSKQIVVVPFPFALDNKKNTQRVYYGAGTILNVLITINNEE